MVKKNNKVKKNIILIGGGGHCISAIDVIEATELYNIVGIVDIAEKINTIVSGYSVIATDNEIDQLAKEYECFHITIGHIKSAVAKIKLFKLVESKGGFLPSIISPLAYCSIDAKIGNGSIVMHHALVNAGSTVGNNCIINSKALVEHNCFIGHNVHISTGAVLNGNCIVKDNSFIGSNAVLKQGITIEKNCIIGAAAVVLKNVQEGQSFVGNPAKSV